MFAITPKFDCPHVKQCYVLPKNMKQLCTGIHNSPCKDCGDTSENWICLTCHDVFCSRYVKGHFMQHFLNNEDHAVGISMADLSCWCYRCEDYVVDHCVDALVREIHKDKFDYYPGERVSNEGEPVEILNKPRSTSHKTREEIEEHFDSEKKVDAAARDVAQLLKDSKHAVVYTGAGISTSAKLPDYRGPNGIWTLRDQGKKPVGAVNIEQATPTYAHYAIRELVDKGFVKYIVSTNVDGLHRRSGVPDTKISELHGNCYRETCENCQKEYLRGFDVTNTVKDHMKHKTGRFCDCGYELKDTIIHFSEFLPKKELELAIRHSKMADLVIVLGTSMRVQPACSLPSISVAQNKGKMVIVNLQVTPYDSEADIRVFSRTDEFMEKIMKYLGIENFDMTIDALAYLKHQ
jgi:mono-ADP-ribosyltransferase sirtuin 6